jgi:hypothetical protein
MGSSRRATSLQPISVADEVEEGVNASRNARAAREMSTVRASSGQKAGGPTSQSPDTRSPTSTAGPEPRESEGDRVLAAGIGLQARRRRAQLVVETAAEPEPVPPRQGGEGPASGAIVTAVDSNSPERESPPNIGAAGTIQVDLGDVELVCAAGAAPATARETTDPPDSSSEVLGVGNEARHGAPDTASASAAERIVVVSPLPGPATGGAGGLLARRQRARLAVDAGADAGADALVAAIDVAGGAADAHEVTIDGADAGTEDAGPGSHSPGVVSGETATHRAPPLTVVDSQSARAPQGGLHQGTGAPPELVPVGGLLARRQRGRLAIGVAAGE